MRNGKCSFDIVDVVQSHFERVIIFISVVRVGYNTRDEVVARGGEILCCSELDERIAERRNASLNVHRFHQFTVNEQREIKITHFIQSGIGHTEGHGLVFTKIG